MQLTLKETHPFNVLIHFQASLTADQGSIHSYKQFEIHKGNLPSVRTSRSRLDLSPISYLSNLYRCSRCRRTYQNITDSSRQETTLSPL